MLVLGGRCVFVLSGQRELFGFHRINSFPNARARHAVPLHARETNHCPDGITASVHLVNMIPVQISFVKEKNM